MQFYRLLVAGTTNLPVGIPPSITSQPQDQNVIVGEGALFSVKVEGTAPFSFQWYSKGLEIIHAGDNAIKVESSHCIFERLTLHPNGDAGLQIGFAHETVNPGANLAAFIEVVNCDS